MSFISLKKYSFLPGVDVVAEVHRRKNSPATVSLAFDEGQYFYVLVPQIISLLEDILHTEHRVLPTVLSSLQTSAKDYAKTALLYREIKETHQIEGVHSSRREIEESAAVFPTQKRRFSEFFMVLAELFSASEPQEVASLEDIRRLYDRITAGELEANTELDGRLFRKSGVQVRSESQKVLHTGFTPEAKLETGLQQMLAEAKHPGTSRILSALLCHFMFETVHPFYDGNGRTGRVLLAFHLQAFLSELTILSLSQAISSHKNLYYSALKEARDVRNQGELTGFLLDMLQLIKLAQATVLDELQVARSLLEMLEKSLQGWDFTDGVFSRKPEVYRQIMSQIGQHFIFGFELGLSLPQLQANLPAKLSEQTLRKYCRDLLEAGLLTAISLRPARFTLTPSGAAALGITEQLFQ